MKIISKKEYTVTEYVCESDVIKESINFYVYADNTPTPFELENPYEAWVKIGIASLDRRLVQNEYTISNIRVKSTKSEIEELNVVPKITSPDDHIKDLIDNSDLENTLLEYKEELDTLLQYRMKTN